jgi:hypothetical protein
MDEQLRRPLPYTSPVTLLRGVTPYMTVILRVNALRADSALLSPILASVILLARRIRLTKVRGIRTAAQCSLRFIGVSYRPPAIGLL